MEFVSQTYETEKQATDDLLAKGFKKESEATSISKFVNNEIGQFAYLVFNKKNYLVLFYNMTKPPEDEKV